MQDIIEKVQECAWHLNNGTRLHADVARDLDAIAESLRRHSTIAARARPVDVPTDATRSNLVDHRLAVLGRDLDIVFHGLAKTTSALRELMHNPNLHPSVKLLADTIAINLLSDPPTDEEPTR